MKKLRNVNDQIANEIMQAHGLVSTDAKLYQIGEGENKIYFYENQENNTGCIISNAGLGTFTDWDILKADYLVEE